MSGSGLGADVCFRPIADIAPLVEGPPIKTTLATLSEVMQHCPICECEVRANPRYPRSACRQCVDRAVASNGEKLEFGQSGPTGEFQARYASTGCTQSSDKLSPVLGPKWLQNKRFMTGHLWYFSGRNMVPLPFGRAL